MSTERSTSELLLHRGDGVVEPLAPLLPVDGAGRVFPTLDDHRADALRLVLEEDVSRPVKRPAVDPILLVLVAGVVRPAVDRQVPLET
eukprot:14910302-Alexandrium_andersonii.AAC.1